MRVVKVARQGFDVKTAGDENLLYSSLWPVLSIYKEIPIKITNPNSDSIITGHDLGYPPMFWDFMNFTNTSNTDGINFFSSLFSVNEKQLIYTAPDTPATDTIQGMVYLFTLDLSKLFIAPTVDIGGVERTPSERSFKLSKFGESVYSSRLKDFVISTDARSPLIHSVNPGTVKGLSFKVEHNLGYIPLSFAYSKSGGYYSILATGGGGGSVLTSTDKYIQFSETADGRELTFVILKDPFEAEQTGAAAI